MCAWLSRITAVIRKNELYPLVATIQWCSPALLLYGKYPGHDVPALIPWPCTSNLFLLLTRTSFVLVGVRADTHCVKSSVCWHLRSCFVVVDLLIRLWWCTVAVSTLIMLKLLSGLRFIISNHFQVACFLHRKPSLAVHLLSASFSCVFLLFWDVMFRFLERRLKPGGECLIKNHLALLQHSKSHSKLLSSEQSCLISY